MKKSELIEWARDNDLREDLVLERAEYLIDQNRTSWQALVVEVFDTVQMRQCVYTQPGYRKNKTGEYVSNSYRRNFGWKNTYYQCAILKINFDRLQFGRK